MVHTIMLITMTRALSHQLLLQHTSDAFIFGLLGLGRSFGRSIGSVCCALVGFNGGGGGGDFCFADDLNVRIYFVTLTGDWLI